MLGWKMKSGSMKEMNTTAFNAVYADHCVVMRKIAVNYGVPYREVEDLIHDTFLAFYCHYALDMNVGKMKALLTKILKNKCIDYVRRERKIEINLGIDLLEDDRRLQSILSTRDTLTIVLEREQREAFWKAMRGMRKDWRDVFYMYFLRGYPMKLVGEILGISEEACRTRISRGRKYLKAELGLL